MPSLQFATLAQYQSLKDALAAAKAANTSDASTPELQAACLKVQSVVKEVFHA